MSKLWLGTAKVDITPERPVPLAGFASRGNKVFDGIKHPLHARILLVKHHDQDGETSAILISADLLWWGSDRVPALKRRIHERFGIPDEAILLHGTHSHSGPQTSRNFSELLGIYDEEYVEQLENDIIEGITMASMNMENVTVQYGKGQFQLGAHRRMMVDGQCVVRANPKAPRDDEVTVVRYVVEEGRTKALLVHYACHPTVTSDNVVSSEFCGVAMDRIEEELGGGMVAAYLQGACADINPARNGELFFDGTDKEVCLFGELLAAEVLRILKGELQSLEDGPIITTVDLLHIPLQKLPTRTELEALTHEAWVKGEWSRAMLASFERLSSTLPLEMVYIQLAKGLSLLALNCEPVTEYGMYAKALAQGVLLPVGYTNGMIGYVTTAKQIDEGGYESDWSTEYFFMPAKLDHAVEPMLRLAISKLIHSASKQ